MSDAATALQSLLAPIIAPLPLIYAEQNAPRPAKPYATLNLISNGASGWLIDSGPDEDGNAVFSEQRLVSAEVQFFGAGAQDRASELGMRIRLPRHVNRAVALGVPIARVRPAISANLLLNETQWEDRGIVEFTAHHIAEITDDVGLIEHVDLDCFSHVDRIDAPNSARSDTPAAAHFVATASFSAPTANTGENADAPAADLAASASLNVAAPVATRIAAPEAADLAAVVALSTAAPTATRLATPVAVTFTATASVVASAPVTVRFGLPGAASLTAGASLDTAAPTAVQFATAPSVALGASVSLAAPQPLAAQFGIPAATDLLATAVLDAPSAYPGPVAVDFTVSASLSTPAPTAVELPFPAEGLTLGDDPVFMDGELVVMV